jgi:hypothetical protein
MNSWKRKWGGRRFPLLWEAFYYCASVCVLLALAISWSTPIEGLFKGTALATGLVGILCFIFGFHRRKKQLPRIRKQEP